MLPAAADLPSISRCRQVEHVRLGRRPVAERQFDGTQHRFFIVVQDERQDLHHLPVAAGLLEKMVLQPLERFRQLNERRAVTQGSRLALDHRQIVAPVIHGPARQIVRPLDEPRVFANDLPFRNDDKRGLDKPAC